MMKKLFTILLGVLFLAGNVKTKAQSFSVQKDTAYFMWPGGTSAVNFIDGVVNHMTGTTDSLTLIWKIVATDFPTDWMQDGMGSSITGVCDNNLCYVGSSLWPSGVTRQSNKYSPNTTGDFHLQCNLSSSSNGSHYMTVRMYNKDLMSDSVNATFVINKWPAAVQQVKPVSEVVLYPNPATTELNVKYDANSDIKTIALYNIIGRMMNVYKATDNSGANLSLENIPSGVYFVRLMNSKGDVVATKKFNKQ